MPASDGKKSPLPALFPAYLALPLYALLFSVPGMLARQETAAVVASRPLEPDARLLVADVAEIVDRFGPRVRGTASHEEAIRYLEDRFLELELVPLGNRGPTSYRFVTPAPDGGPPLVSLVGARSGTHPDRGYRLLSAHHDTVPESPGAEDDASGVAVVLEAARLTRDMPLAEDLLFAIFDGEEDGLLGSEAFAASLDSFPMGRPKAMVSLDMVGWAGGSPTLHTFAYADAETGRPRVASDSLVSSLFAWASAVDSPLALGDPYLGSVYPIVVRTLRAPHGSDDGPFTRRGVPALLLASSSFTNFYPHYHRPTDTPDRVGESTLGRCAAVATRWLAHGEPGYQRMADAIEPVRIPFLGFAAALPALFAARRRPGGWLGKAGLFLLLLAFLLGFRSAILGATLPLWLWPLAAGRALPRRLLLLAVAAIPFAAILATLGAVIAVYGTSSVTPQSAWPLAQVGWIGLGLVAAYAGAPRLEPVPRTVYGESTGPLCPA